MSKRVEALVEPELLVWARERAGFEIPIAARKARVSADRLAAWEEGVARPSVKQLRRLAHVYKRRLAVFYLPEPPRDFTPIKDYRRVWGDALTTPSPELLTEIKAAHERREVALELLESNGERIAPFPLRATLDDDPEALAGRVRRALEIDSDRQSDWDNDRVAFNAWRFSAERLGALVLQMTEVKSREARGFSIAERTVPVVVANNQDPFAARSFTVVHELVHVAIRQSGICDLRTDRGRVERFCNRVAGAVLVPAEELLKEDIVAAHRQGTHWGDDELVGLARRYRASREVVLRRLLIHGRTDGAFYRRKRKQLQDEYERRAEEPKETGPIPPSTKAVIRAGHSFSRLVLSSYSHQLITASDVASYLGVRMKHVPKIESDVFRRGA